MKINNLLSIILSTITIGLWSCNDGRTIPATAPKNQKAEIISTVCVYTLGSVQDTLRDAMMDSLTAHYPKCRFVKNLALPKSAITNKRHDHTRYISNLLNAYLAKYSTDSTIVIGLTTADIGKDNFRNRPHSGIMGEAKGIGVPVAVFSSYRPRNNTQLFSVMLHEIGHTQGLRHCPNSDCMMQNAKGGNPFNKTNHFCDKCKTYMQSKYWKL